MIIRCNKLFISLVKYIRYIIYFLDIMSVVEGDVEEWK